MSTSSRYNATQYEAKHQGGFGLVYPESHIIRIHRHILEWELGIRGGNVLDFGCGPGAHVRYFADCGFVPYGCDVSQTAIERARTLLPNYAHQLLVNPVEPDLAALFPGVTLDVFLANQVLYYLGDAAIKRLVSQVWAMMRPGGAFVATMMAPSCWYARRIVSTEGEFSSLLIESKRQHETTLVNLKRREELPDLFHPFERRHLGFYSWHLREEEGGHDHWAFVGVKP